MIKAMEPIEELVIDIDSRHLLLVLFENKIKNHSENLPIGLFFFSFILDIFGDVITMGLWLKIGHVAWQNWHVRHFQVIRSFI